MHAVVLDGLLFKIAFRSVYELFVYREKRIRKSFAKRENVLDVPFLLATQIDSYAKFYSWKTLLTNVLMMVCKQHSILFSRL